MPVADLPLAEPSTVKRLLAKDDWIMLAVHTDDEGLALLEQLYVTDDPVVDNYRWYRVDASTDEGDAVLAERGIAPGNRYVILSPYQDAVGLWVLDELDDRQPEDLLRFMDDHAAELELEEWEDEFDDLE